jgi:hypothetical protein
MSRIAFCATYSEVVISIHGTTGVFHGDGTILSAIALIVNYGDVAPVTRPFEACCIVAVYNFGRDGEEGKGSKCHKGSEEGTTREKHVVSLLLLSFLPHYLLSH